METLQLLVTALGLSALAGVNLYLTVFVAGMAIRFGGVALSPQMQGLQILGEPAVLIFAGVLLAIELIADKVPYVDSAWDAVHTAIRPVGGAFLALRAIGDLDPALEVMAVLLGGTMALATHATKAGARLAVNTSPEPVSNAVVSTAENVCVVFGSWAVLLYPLALLVLFLGFLAVFIYFAPKLFRIFRRAFSRFGFREQPRPPVAPPLL